MWLLDVNLPNGLAQTLRQFGIQCETTEARGWRNLSNGALASKAFEAGFKLILTKDRLFGDSAAKALKKFPQLSVVIIGISQSRQTLYLKEFEKKWKVKPIEPVPGSILEWP